MPAAMWKPDWNMQQTAKTLTRTTIIPVPTAMRRRALDGTVTVGDRFCKGRQRRISKIKAHIHFENAIADIKYVSSAKALRLMGGGEA